LLIICFSANRSRPKNLPKYNIFTVEKSNFINHGRWKTDRYLVYSYYGCIIYNMYIRIPCTLINKLFTTHPPSLQCLNAFSDLKHNAEFCFVFIFFFSSATGCLIVLPTQLTAMCSPSSQPAAKPCRSVTLSCAPNGKW